VINKQRQAIYKKRDQILQSEFDESKKNEFVQEVKDEVKFNISDILAKQINAARQMSQSVTEYLAIMKKEFSFNM
jgi:preprotein translocase subunit SecA